MITDPNDMMHGDSIVMYQRFLEAQDNVDNSLPSGIEAHMVVLPHVTARPFSWQGTGTFLRFEGVAHAKMSRGEHTTSTWQYSCTYAFDENSQAVELTSLLKSTHLLADSRMVLRTPTITGPAEYRLIGVLEYNETPQGGGVTVVTFTATQVSENDEFSGSSPGYYMGGY